jgi:mannose/fructose/N-acetylgalactosamine-specific phosphotransferase system component IIC
MVSRPIVTAPLIGWIMGNAGAGLVIGVVLELLFIGDLPVGKYVPVHETGLSILSTAMALTALGSFGAGSAVGAGGPGVGGEGVVAVGGAAASAGLYGLNLDVLPLIPVVLLVALPASYLYQRADHFVRVLNRRFFLSAEAALLGGRPVNLVLENLKGLLTFFVVNAVVLFFTVAPLMYASKVLSEVLPGALPEVPPGAFYIAFAGCVAIGVAAAFNVVFTKRSAYIFPASAVIAALAFFVAC